MNLLTAPSPRRLTTVGVASALLAMAGCSTLDSAVNGEKLDYRSQANKTAPLDIPPDLTQLAREGRYQPQAGVVVSANAMKSPGGAAPVAAPTNVVAVNALGDMRVERQGNSRWLSTKLTPEQLYPQIKAFWLARGFVLTVDSPETGVMQTDWAENRAKLPNDFIRNSIGKIFSSLSDTSERDLFRTRIERTDKGTEVFVSHRGAAEMSVGTLNANTKWAPRPSDPNLEAEMLARLMLRLGGASDEAGARSALAQAVDTPARARASSADGPSTMELDEGFDRAWRQVGLALDRGGFTVEDRDRSAGLYFVRYIDPKFASQEEPGFFSKLFSSDSDKSKRTQRYRVAVKAEGTKSRVSVLNADGVPESGDAARNIVARLIDELR